MCIILFVKVDERYSILEVFLDADGINVSYRHLARVPDYLWLAEDGMKMQGYSNSTSWDTSFAVQAIIATGLAPEFSSCLRRAHHAIDRAQVRIHHTQLIIDKGSISGCDLSSLDACTENIVDRCLKQVKAEKGCNETLRGLGKLFKQACEGETCMHVMQ